MPADPQSWNRYAYVQNNPLKFIDPSGKTLTLTGADAESLVGELEKKTGYQLTRDAKTGVVTIDKNTKRNDKGTSDDLAKQLAEIIKDSKTAVTIDVGQNQTGVWFDSFAKKTLDFADYKAVDAAAPEFAAASLGHVLREYYEAAKDPKLSFADAHKKGLEFEGKVLSDYTGKREKVHSEGLLNRTATTATVRMIYTSVTYDVMLKSGGSVIDTVGTVTKTTNSKPGVP